MLATTPDLTLFVLLPLTARRGGGPVQTVMGGGGSDGGHGPRRSHRRGGGRSRPQEVPPTAVVQLAPGALAEPQTVSAIRRDERRKRKRSSFGIMQAATSSEDAACRPRARNSAPSE